ncbi:MAG: hypothetical protein APR56_04950 [Methanosaeta sp. SDB]|nr:MAG: hypothetical protein APR56_04950 [Methanosaeta sp. SDB]
MVQLGIIILGVFSQSSRDLDARKEFDSLRRDYDVDWAWTSRPALFSFIRPVLDLFRFQS